MRQRRVRWSIGNGCGHAIAVAVLFLAATGDRGAPLGPALPCAALVAAVAFVVGSGAAYLAATLRARRCSATPASMPTMMRPGRRRACDPRRP